MKISLLILTYNEMIHLKRLLRNINMFDEIIFIDSYSNDGTATFIEKYSKINKNIKYFKNRYYNQSKQLDWTIKNIKFKNDFIFKLDADEVISDDLLIEIKKIFSENNKIPSSINGFYVKRNIYFMQKPLKWGGVYNLPVIRIFRKDNFKIESRSMDEHILVKNFSKITKGCIKDINLNDFVFYIKKHINYAINESNEIKNTSFENSKEKMPYRVYFKKKLKYQIYYKLPPIFRSFMVFIYRYLILFGFLDGRKGFYFHFINSFLYRAIVDLIILLKKDK